MLIKDVLNERYIDKKICIYGWIENKSKSFFILRDGSCFDTLQCLYEDNCNIGDFVKLKGLLTPSFNLLVYELEVLGIENINLREKKNQALIILKNTIYFETHNFFNKIGAYHVSKTQLNEFIKVFPQIYYLNDELIFKSSFTTLENIINDVELYFNFIIKKIIKKQSLILEFFKNNLSFNDKLIRKTYTDCFKLLETNIQTGKIIINANHKNKILQTGLLVLNKRPKFGDNFDLIIKKYLIKEYGQYPLFITHYPSLIKNNNIYEFNNELTLSAELIVSNVDNFIDIGINNNGEFKMLIDNWINIINKN